MDDLCGSLSKAVGDAKALSATSVRTYKTRLGMLTTTTGKPLAESLASATATYRKLQAKYDSPITRKNVLTAVVAVFKRNPAFRDAHAREWASWQAKYLNLIRIERQIQDDNRMTDRFKEKMVDLRDARAAAARLRASGLKTARDSMQHLLILMMVDMPPKRSDLGALRVRTDTAKSGNFVVVPKAGPVTLVMHDYKTAKTHGVFREQLPPKIGAALRRSIRDFPRDHVFEADGEPMNPERYGKFVEATFHRHLGKRAGINVLRHSYIMQVVDPLKMTIAERKAVAASMCHNVDMQDKYFMVAER